MAKATANAPVTLDMTSRYLGLVVVPGKHIVKIEVEKFSSQLSQEEKAIYMNEDMSSSTAL